MDPTSLPADASISPVLPADTSFADFSRDAINAIAAEYTVDPEGEIPAEAVVAATPEASPAPALPAVTPAAPSEDPAVQRGLDRLVAREVEISRREAAVQDFERQRQSYEQELRALRDRASIADRLSGGDPEDALAALGYDPNHAVQLILAKRMGDKAPPELRQALEQARRDREIRDLRAEIDAGKHRAAESDFHANLATAARKHLEAIPAESPLAMLRGHDAARAESELAAEVLNDAKARVARGEDPRAPLITLEEAARRLEARYSFARPASPAPVATPVAASTPAPTTPASPGAQTAPRPPVAPRPLKPWHAQNQRELEEAGVQAGLAAARAARTSR